MISNIKKNFYKFFNKDKYNSIKTDLIVKKSIKTFNERTKEKIEKIFNNIEKKKELNFLHSGHCGDIICSLSVLKELSKTHKCNLFIEVDKRMSLPYFKHPAGKVFLDERIFNMLYPLLKNQNFLNDIKRYNNEEIDVDLNIFREMPINLSFNSVRWFFHITGIHCDLNEPYLSSADHKTMKNKIIIHRSFRYRNNFINYDFLNNYENLYFIGLPNEYEDLKKQINKLNFYDCVDYQDMACIIKSSKFFLGNSSLAFPMAEALKVPRILEACPDFPIMQPIGKDAFDFYYQPHFEKLFNFLNNKYSNNK